MLLIAVALSSFILKSGKNARKEILSVFHRTSFFTKFRDRTFQFFVLHLLGRHQDHRQEQAGQGQPGKGHARGRGHEAPQPPQHHQALPSDDDQEHDLHRV